MTREKELLLGIDEIEKKIENTVNENSLELLKTNLDLKRKGLNDIIDLKVNGIIIRSKGQYVHFNEFLIGHPESMILYDIFNQ